MMAFSRRPPTDNARKVLVVGLCCVDVVSYVDKFPAEDSDTRVFEQRKCLGGNAANNVTILAQLCGREGCELFSALPDGESADGALLDSLIAQSGIDVGRSVRRPNAQVPISTIIVSRVSGTRTILHYRGDLPELSCKEFVAAFPGDSLSRFGWIHFEGRNFDEVRQMMQFVRSFRPVDSTLPRISVELEKIRPFPYLEQLIPLADLVFVSKDFAKSKGWNDAKATIDGIQRQFNASNTAVICPWGEKGAAARPSLDAPLLFQPSYPLSDPVIDTLAAGDCFIGTALCHLSGGRRTLEEVLREAVKMAGRKCMRKGLLGLVEEAEAEER